MLAKKLDGRLRDHVMNSRNNLFSDSNTMNYQRPGQSVLPRSLGSLYRRDVILNLRHNDPIRCY